MKYLLVNTVDPGEVISVVVRFVELGVEFLDTMFETHDLVV